MNPLTQIPALYRKYLYIAYGVVALAVGALAVFYAATPDTVLPDWLEGVQRVIAYLAIPFGALAGSNVNSSDRPQPAPDNPPAH